MPQVGCAPATLDILTASSTQTNAPFFASSRTNADSVVVRVGLDGRHVVLPGDAEGLTQGSVLRNAARNGLPLEASVVVGSHHGANTQGSNGANWAAAWRAPIAAFSAQSGSYGHPRCDVVGDFAIYAAPTTSQMTITCGRPQGGARTSARHAKRIITSEENGHVLLRITTADIAVLCQTVSAACDGPLPLGTGP